IALFVEVAQLAAQSGVNVLDPELEVVPEVCDGVFEIEHDAGGSGVEHLHHQFGIVGRAGHLVSLILAPLEDSYIPFTGGPLRCRKVIRQLAGVRLGEHSLALGNELSLARSETRVKWKKKIQKSGREIAFEVDICGRGVDGKSVKSFHAA